MNLLHLWCVFMFFRENMLRALQPRSLHGLELPDLLHLQEGMQQTDLPR